MLLTTTEKRGTFSLGFKWVTYWSELEAFFLDLFFGGRFHRRQAPIQIIGGFLPLVPCTPDQEQELGLFLLHVLTRLCLASCSHTSLGPPLYQSLRPRHPIRSNYPLEFKQEGREREGLKLPDKISSRNFQNKTLKVCRIENLWHFPPKYQHNILNSFQLEIQEHHHQQATA